jgi:hypothetical protein
MSSLESIESPVAQKPILCGMSTLRIVGCDRRRSYASARPTRSCSRGDGSIARLPAGAARDGWRPASRRASAARVRPQSFLVAPLTSIRRRRWTLSHIPLASRSRSCFLLSTPSRPGYSLHSFHSYHVTTYVAASDRAQRRLPAHPAAPSAPRLPGLRPATPTSRSEVAASSSSSAWLYPARTKDEPGARKKPAAAWPKKATLVFHDRRQEGMRDMHIPQSKGTPLVLQHLITA